jgi:hypothetical protein
VRCLSLFAREKQGIIRTRAWGRKRRERKGGNVAIFKGKRSVAGYLNWTKAFCKLTFRYSLKTSSFSQEKKKGEKKGENFEI